MGRQIRQGPRSCSRAARAVTLALITGLAFLTLVSASGAQRPSGRANAGSNSAEFRGVKDRVPLGLRDTAALVRLAKQAGQIKPQRKDDVERSEAILQSASEHPERYRGVPVEVRGIARRLFSSQSPIERGNRLYEIWITTAGKGPNPVACLVEQLPDGFPDRPVISEHVAARGFFLKLMAYKVGEKEFVAPVLVGTLEHHPVPDENVIEPPRDEVFVRLPDGLENRSVGPPLEEKLTLRLDRNGRVLFDGESISRGGLAKKVEQLAGSVRYNVRAAGVLLPDDRELPVALTLRAPDETPCVVICRLMLDCQSHGFLKYMLELESGNDPPVKQPANAPSPPARNLPALSEEERTLRIRVGADPRGRIGPFQIVSRAGRGTDALTREITAILKDPNAPFDRADVELDPRLKFFEMVRLARLLSNPLMTKVRFTPVDPALTR
jgi:hypothetical protein